MERVFKTKTFARWSRKVISDGLLLQAAKEIEQGLLDADLGGGVYKKRIALPGRGKSGSTRMLIAQKHKQSIFFIAGREKRDPGSDFSDKELEVAKVVAQALTSASHEKLDELVNAQILKEIRDVK